MTTQIKACNVDAQGHVTWSADTGATPAFFGLFGLYVRSADGTYQHVEDFPTRAEAEAHAVLINESSRRGLLRALRELGPYHCDFARSSINALGGLASAW